MENPACNLEDNMPIRIPHFRRRTGNGTDRHSEFIEMDGLCIHKIDNMGAFHAAFGYTPEIAKSGILPDEFIWEEYIRDKSLTDTECLQIRLIEYLRGNSEVFSNKYWKQSAEWIASHAKAISSRGSLCFNCKMKPFCLEQIYAISGFRF